MELHSSTALCVGPMAGLGTHGSEERSTWSSVWPAEAKCCGLMVTSASWARLWSALYSFSEMLRRSSSVMASRAWEKPSAMQADWRSRAGARAAGGGRGPDSCQGVQQLQRRPPQGPVLPRGLPGPLPPEHRLPGLGTEGLHALGAHASRDSPTIP